MKMIKYLLLLNMKLNMKLFLYKKNIYIYSYIPIYISIYKKMK